jgi:DsbC/DsbD-like thiol-disulfide interchange protein
LAHIMTKQARHSAAVVLLICSAFAWSQAGSVDQPHCRATLLCEQTQVEPGQSVTVGLLLEPDEHWHTYWQNPGDAGLATKVRWTLPEGFEAGPIQWPTPQRFEAEGPIVTYGYEGQVLLMTEIAVPEEVATDTVTLAGKASWLVCDAYACLLGFRELAIDLPVTQTEVGVATQATELFAAARARLPRVVDEADQRIEVSDEGLLLFVSDSELCLTADSVISFFACEPGLFDHDVVHRPFKMQGVAVQLSLLKPLPELPERLTGVLVVDEASYAIDVPIVEAE